MATITWAINADFAKSGTAYGTALTDYVTNPGGRLSLQRGLGKDGVYQVSRLTLTLNNSTGIFTPDNSAGSLYGMLEPEVPIQVTATYNSVEYAVWTGYIKSYRNTWASGQIAQCVIECEDISAFLWQFSPVNVVDAERTSGAAMTAIFAAMGLTSDDYDVATGAETFPHHWVRNTDGLGAAMEVLRSEMGGLLYVTGDGVAVFEGRDQRIGLNRWKQQVLRDSPSVLWMFNEASGATVYDHSGNARDLTLYNSPTRGQSAPWPADPAKATTFDGLTEYGDTPDADALDPGDTFTLEAILKLTAAANLVTNGDFEVNTTGWILNDTGAVSTEQAYVGSTSLKLTNNTLSGANPFFGYQSLTLPGPGTYVITVRVYVPTSWGGGTIRLSDNGQWSGATANFPRSANMGLRDQWQTLTATVTPAADLTGLIGIQATTMSADGTSIYVDGVTMIKLPSGCIADKGTGGYQLRLNTSGQVELLKTGTAVIVASTVALTEGDWTHIVATKAGSTAKIYLDGVDVTGTVSNQTIAATASSLTVCRTVAGADYFDGVVAALALHGAVLSEARRLKRYYAYKYGAWGDGTSIFPRAIDYELDDTDLVSTASVKAQIIVDSDPTQVVFGFSRNGETIGGRTADSISLAAGAQYGPFEMDYARPILSLSTPVAGEDYKANSAADGKGTDLTDDLSVTVTDLGAGFRATLKNTGASTLYITKFELQGLPADALFDRPQFTTTKPISGNKADLGVSILLAYANDDARPPKAQDYSHALASRYRWPYPRVALAFDVNGATKLPAFLALELGDLVRYTDTGLGVSQPTNVVAGAYLDDWYYVEAIRLDAVVGDAIETFSAVVTLVPSWLYRDLDRIAYDLFARDNASGDLGTALSGDAWADDTGFDIASETARANTDTESIANVDLGALAFDHVVEVALAAIGTGDEVGLAFRYVDANNHYRVYLDKGSNEVILEKKIAGVVTELSSPAYTVGTTAELRVMVQGNRFRVWVGRRLYIDTTDAALNTGTKVGLWARNANATTTFDQFYAEAL